MRVRSKLADVEFRIGNIERQDDELIINSHPDQAMKARVFLEASDVLSMLGGLVRSPAAWGFLVKLPWLWLRSEKLKVKSSE